VWIHLAALVCALGTATLTPMARVRRAGWGGIVLGFGLVAAWSRFQVIPDPMVLGAGVAVAMGVLLARPDLTLLAGIGAGALAAFSTAVLFVMGLPVPSALLLSLGTLVASGLTAHRPGFAPASIQENSILLVGALALALAAAPTVADGWRSADIINLNDAPGQPVDFGLWITFGPSLLVMGAGYTLWWRRR
jgi:hypothetical protein